MRVAEHAAILFELIRNAALLALGVLGYCLVRAGVRDRLPRLADPLLYGAIFGALGVMSMLAPIETVTGLRLDLRNAMVAVGTLFGGIGTGAVTLALITSWRLMLGGPGVITGLLSLAIAFVVSAGTVIHLGRRSAPVDRRSLCAVGLAVGLTELGFVVLFPRPTLSTFLLLDVAPIWVVMMPLTIVFLGSIILYFERSQAMRRALSESEQRFRSFYNETPVMLTATDPDGRVVAVSDHWLEIMGYERHEVIGRSRWEFMSPASAAHLRTDVIPELERTGRARTADLQLIRKDGSLIDVSVNSVLRRDPATGGLRALTYSIDQTARKQAERALLETERQLQAIMDNAPFAIFLKDREGRYRLLNRTYEQWFLERAETLYGKTNFEIFPRALAEEMSASDHEVLNHGRVTTMERRTEKAQPGLEFTLATKFPIRNEPGAIVGVAGFIADITDRKRAELALKESRDLLEESQELGKVGYALSDVTTDRVYWSDSLFTLRGRPKRTFFTYEETMEFMHPEDRAKYAEARDAAIAARRDFTIDIRVIRDDGSVGWEHCVGHPRFAKDGMLNGVLLVVLDVTESRLAQDALRQSEERFRALIEHSSDVIAVATPDGRVTYRSPNATEGLGYDTGDRATMVIFDLVHPDDVAELAKTFKTIGATPGGRAAGLSRVRHKDGSWRHIAWSARNAAGVPGVDGIILNFRDVTEAQKLEEQLLQSQKMEAVGQLAGGIAHDFNNILGAILGFAGFLLQDLPTASPERGFAERITAAGERAKDLVQQILAFARGSGVERKPTDLAQIIAETQDLLRASLPSSTHLEIAVKADGLIANVNAGQISQILLNLCLNANDALAGEPGTIAIEASRVSPGDADVALFNSSAAASLSEGRITAGKLAAGRFYAKLTVGDTGVGMDASVLGRIFEPFFTTKQRGQGTGLGLSVVHGIVISCEGACAVTSRPLAGSVFIVYLPIADVGALPAPAARHEKSLRGHERILVVDDEPIMTDMLTIGLDRLGYEVVALNDPEEAIQALAEEPTAWDVVISDQVMPGMKGLTLFRRMKQIRPELRFVLCTGFSDGATEEAALAAGAHAFFLKPVSPERLAAGIRRIFDQSVDADSAAGERAT